MVITGCSSIHSRPRSSMMLGIFTFDCMASM